MDLNILFASIAIVIWRTSLVSGRQRVSNRSSLPANNTFALLVLSPVIRFACGCQTTRPECALSPSYYTSLSSNQSGQLRCNPILPRHLCLVHIATHILRGRERCNRGERTEAHLTVTETKSAQLSSWSSPTCGGLRAVMYDIEAKRQTVARKSWLV